MVVASPPLAQLALSVLATSRMEMTWATARSMAAGLALLTQLVRVVAGQRGPTRMTWATVRRSAAESAAHVWRVPIAFAKTVERTR